MVFIDVFIMLLIIAVAFTIGRITKKSVVSDSEASKEAPKQAVCFPQITVVFQQEIDDDEDLCNEVADMYLSNRAFYYSGKTPSVEVALLPEKEMDERIVSLLEKVGMKADDMEKYAYEFSGGQRQRIGIARALSVNPEFLLCDEPISALDVSIQAQVVNVLEDLQQELGLTYLFVAHDLSMVRHISDRIGVMYLGKIVESGDSDEVYDNPCHPYTRALLASIPIADPKRALSLEHCGIEGDLPSPLHVPSGCRFHTRCPYATEQCRQQEPELEERTPGHMVACWKK